MKTFYLWCLLGCVCVGQTVKLSVLSRSTSTDEQKYVLNNPALDSVTILAEWADWDKGPSANPQYNFATIDAALAPLVPYGHKINIIGWAVPDDVMAVCTNGATSGTGNCTTPAYVWDLLTSSNYVTCPNLAGPQRIPNYLSPAYISAYQKAISALYQHLATNPAIGYIRFGIGHGGEAMPMEGWDNTTTPCGKAFAAWGMTISTWENFLAAMLKYEAAMGPGKQLLIGITPMGTPSSQVPDFIASVAAPLGIGFGTQGLAKADVGNCKGASADWCNLFAKYPAPPLHELQQLLTSCPDNASCATGALTNWLPWAVSSGATNVELYTAEWMVAFNPATPGNAQYGAAYAAAINKAAGVGQQPAAPTGLVGIAR